ncbi:response regulator [Paenibacillus dokdonensis]|uniref:response regulator n=1 Tax=Paenibacillus dokdonensis TaxID=2567944 RepID=UPI0010A7CD2A|nr:response regulator [Paenibacillus dokdonensis]
MMRRDHYTILCVEDNPINMALMHHIFKKYPQILLLKADSAEQAFELVEEEKPDLILMDIQLPGMDGYEALNYLKSKKDTRHIPIMAVSSYAMDSDIARGLKAGFAEYITKPIDLKIFLGRVRELILETEAAVSLEE